MNNRILVGDVTERLRELPDESVQCVVTSPPYWGLRDYGVEGQLGLERTPAEYICKMVRVFAEVKRVLRDDGTLWLNMGDSYSGSWARSANPGGTGESSKMQVSNRGSYTAGESECSARICPPGLKPKDLCGIPWMLAFALRSDGWYLRSDIIWHKPNPMPESVTDRPTKSHEYLFLLAKSATYYYDADAIAEQAQERGEPDDSKLVRQVRDVPRNGGMGRFTRGGGSETGFGSFATRNKRTVWTVPTQSFSEAHFATFPKELIQPCILAGSRPAGKRCDCAEIIETPLGTGQIDDPTMLTGRAGMNRPRRPDEGTRPITRHEQRQYAEQIRESPYREEIEGLCGAAIAHYIRTDRSGARPLPPNILEKLLDCGKLKLARRECDCPIEPADTVLDPFAGAGTTGLVAMRYRRNFIGIELNPEYAAMAERRIVNDAPMFNAVQIS